MKIKERLKNKINKVFVNESEAEDDLTVAETIKAFIQSFSKQSASYQVVWVIRIIIWIILFILSLVGIIPLIKKTFF